MNDVSVWTETAGLSIPYLTRSLLAARLAVLGFTGSEDEVDVDALMVLDSSARNQWDRGDEILVANLPVRAMSGCSRYGSRWHG